MIAIIIGFKGALIKQSVTQGAWAIKRSSHNLIVAEALGRIVFSAPDFFNKGKEFHETKGKRFFKRNRL